MAALIVNRTLVKSPPELWSEVSDVQALARHLGEFGAIEISRLEAEHTVAWEGEGVRGTVQLEASGWGTKVTLSADLPAPEAPSPTEPPVALEEELSAAPETAARAKRESRVRRWFFRRRTGEPEPDPQPLDEESLPQPRLAWYDPDPDEIETRAQTADEPVIEREHAQSVLEQTLDSLGAAHHRPFSRNG